VRSRLWRLRIESPGDRQLFSSDSRRTIAEAPHSYTIFIDSMLSFVKSKGMIWAISLDESGKPLLDSDWDLRALTNSHDRVASRLNGFAVDDDTRTAALQAGWSPASVAQGHVLPAEAQDFIKALVAHRGRRKHFPKVTRHAARIYRRFLSVTAKPPWELNTEDFDRFIALGLSDINVIPVISELASVMNENLLSNNCPLAPFIPEKCSIKFLFDLHARKDGKKLPDEAALLELTRIVFQEKPLTHQDHIRFCTFQILILTGLRLNEVLMLPHDCMRWKDHIDFVTNVPAGEVGGISKSLRIRYFALKDEESLPNLLIEKLQPAPEKFEQQIANSIAEARAATRALRSVLVEQHKDPKLGPGSDLRRFVSNTGTELSTADLLFLVMFGRNEPLPPEISLDCAIALSAQSSLYQFLRGSAAVKSVFETYGSSPETWTYKITPHSLRHLMNTEYFRLNIADTIITEQFGRQSVAKSHDYEHKSLAERLKFVTLPPAALKIIRAGSAQELVAKMVVSGIAAVSHIGESFRKIQAEHGDESAFLYLSANSDGFHVTPYGFCINSFSVNPCARHLKCFDGCKSFVASGRREHIVTLEGLKVKLSVMRDQARARPAKSIGRKNQISHAEKLLIGVKRALESQPLALVFPDGVDYSEPRKDMFS